MAEPLLTLLDRQTPAWLKVKAHLEARLAKLRVRNDRLMAEDETARLRGAIAELKYLIALDRDPPEVAREDQFKD